jgi:3-isopropylmalate dehydrogenase
MYEPIHGSAPDIAGQGKANPIAAILTVAMLLRHSLGLHQEAGTIEAAVEQVIEAGYRTEDLQEVGKPVIGTQEMGQLIVDALAV